MNRLNKLTDDKLVAAYADGDSKAFDTLLLRHQSRVYSYILSFVKNRDIADDIFQETFIKAITKIRQGRYAEAGKFSSWITRVSHNIIIDHYRQTRTDISISADDDTADVLNNKDLSEGNIEDALIDLQTTSDIHSIVASLPANQQEVIDMRFFRDMSFKEIAEATGVSINTALGRMRYALINMRRIAAERDIALTSA